MSQRFISYSLEDRIAKCKMYKKPLVFVEGYDDIPLYKGLCKKETDIVASELVYKNKCEEAYVSGCEGVIEIITDLQETIENDISLENRLLGIIDADRRCWLNDSEPINLKCIFILKYYSYESYFVTLNSAKKLVKVITSVTDDDLSDEFNCKLEINKTDGFKLLYYSALDVLKKDCLNSDYKSVFDIDTAIEAIRCRGDDAEKLRERYEELDEFAAVKGINFPDDVHRLVKGKVLLRSYVQIILNTIKELHNNCRVNKKCSFCIRYRESDINQCIWKLKKGYQVTVCENTMIEHNKKDEPELQHIADKLNSLGEA